MSPTLRRGLSDEIGSWKIIWSRGRSRASADRESVVTSTPSKRTEPAVGLGSCMMARPVVDFPQPDSPTTPRVSPSITSMLKSLTAWTLRPRPAGNSTVRCSTPSSAPSRRWAVPGAVISGFLVGGATTARGGGSGRGSRVPSPPGRSGTGQRRPARRLRGCARARTRPLRLLARRAVHGEPAPVEVARRARLDQRRRLLSAELLHVLAARREPAPGRRAAPGRVGGRR